MSSAGSYTDSYSSRFIWDVFGVARNDMARRRAVWRSVVDGQEQRKRDASLLL